MSESYRQIFKSTALIGGAEVINVISRVIRTKILAILLGTSGMGIAGIFESVTGLVGLLTGFGIGGAGVRQIAESVGTGDDTRISRTIRTLRLTSIVSGLLGMLITLLFCSYIGYVSFGNYSYTAGIALMSLTLLFNGISTGQKALLQGMRRLRDLAACEVLGVVFGTISSITLVYFLRERGIAPYLVAVSAFGILSSWWYARRVKVKTIKIRPGDIVEESRSLLNMGVAFMISGLLLTGSDYFTRVMVARQLGMGAAGLYGATWALSTFYIGIILNAMGADFYPRLTAVASDNVVVNQLVNEQIEMGILIALPGILGTLTLAPWVLKTFYSAEFMPAADVIRWQILGVSLRVVSWPMGFIQLGKGMPKLFTVTEVLKSAVYLTWLLICMKFWGLEGVGISFLALYITYSLGMLGVCNRISGFRWSKRAVLLILASSCAVTAVFIMVRFLPVHIAIVLGLIVTAVVSLGCLLELHRLLKFDIRKFIPSRINWGKTKI